MVAKFKVHYQNPDGSLGVLFVEFPTNYTPDVDIYDAMRLGLVIKKYGRWIGIPAHRILKLEEVKDLEDIGP